MGGLTSVFQDSEGNPARFLAIFLWLSFLASLEKSWKINITSLLSYGLHFLNRTMSDGSISSKKNWAVLWLPMIGTQKNRPFTAQEPWNWNGTFLSGKDGCQLLEFATSNIETFTRKQQNVRGGPNYKVQLLADFVLPDLVLSHELLGVKVLTRMLTRDDETSLLL